MAEDWANSVLRPHVTLSFDDPDIGDDITVADILADPDRFDGETLADPIEGPPYGYNCAIVQRRHGVVTIFSWAHGGTRYRLQADEFNRDDKGHILDSDPSNIRLAIEMAGIELRHNEFSTQTEVYGLPGFGPELTDAGAIRIRFQIHENHGFLPSQSVFEQTLVDVAYQHKFHPVRDYLDSLKWDGVPRIGTWLVDYAGAEASEFNCAVGRIFLIAAVRRVREPGCKYDTMLVFKSRQGRDKSKALRILAVRDEWFTDSLDLSADTKEVIEQTSGVWIVESADLSGIGRRDVNHLKSFLSRQDDRARPAYGRRTARVSRQFVTAGSTNDAQFLLDDENRRFWPVTIIVFDTEALTNVVEQLWAEAAHYEAKGESIVLDRHLWEAAAKAQTECEVEDPIRDRLTGLFGGKDGWVKSSTVWDYLNVPLERQPSLCLAVGRAMKALGFKYRQARGDDLHKGMKRGQRYYERANPSDPTAVEVEFH